MGFQAGHHPERSLDLALRKRGGWFIHDQDPGVDRKRAYDLDQLLLRRSQFLQQTLRAASEADGVKEFGRSPAHAVVIYAPESVPGHVAQKDVFVDAEITEEARMLVHNGNAATGGFER